MATDDQLVLIYHFSADSKIVFDAWTKPEWMKAWLFKSSDNKILSVKTDLKVGGKFSILELNKNEKINHFGEYLEIKTPCKLVFTLEVPWHFSGVSKVFIEITDTRSGCEMIFTQSGIDTSITKNSWEKMFENLKSVIKQKQ